MGIVIEESIFGVHFRKIYILTGPNVLENMALYNPTQAI